MAENYGPLYSHSVDKHASVQQAMSRNLTIKALDDGRRSVAPTRAFTPRSDLDITIGYLGHEWSNRLISVQINILTVKNMADLLPPLQIPIKHYRVFFLLCFWGLWNHRHDVVLRGKTTYLRRLIVRCIDDATLCAERLIVEDMNVFSAWKEIISSSL
uniref:Uncharacterized protein n=1 Tax=Oryza meridionalis TaxID=40149 RepID=A0A0E0DPY8_9ORYZ